MDLSLHDCDAVSSFWKDYFEKSPNSERCLNIILQKYAHPGRFYHSLSHIVYGISRFAESEDILKLKLNERTPLALAWACHDIKYDTKRPDANNVKASAKMAVIFARGMSMPHIQERKAARAVLITAHAQPPENLLEKAILDLDLSILGADRETYEKYERGIRQEYSHVPFDYYRQARIGMLRSKFLEKERLFWLDSFHNKYDSARKVNLAWSISILEQGIDYLNQ